jgi:hypothetical protein
MKLSKSGKSQIAEFTWGLGKSGKCPKLLAEPAERSFHKHNEFDVLGSVNLVSPAPRTVGRFLSPSLASGTLH